MTDNQSKEIWSSCKCGAEREGTPQDNEQAICPDCNRTGCYVLAYDCDLSPTCKCEDCTKEHEPTPGAVRAAERIVKTVINNFNQFPTKEHKSEAINLVATLIDQEIAAPELLEVLKEIAKGEGPYSRDQLTFANNTISAMKELAQAAIAKSREVQDVKD